MIFKNLVKIKNCPICNFNKILFKGKIKSKSIKINDYFSLIECKNCNHRFLSEFPKPAYLETLYKSNSPYVFGHDANEEIQIKKFKKNGFKDVIPFKKHWIFKYISINEKKEYLEIGPGLCKMYKTFYDNGWKCNGIDIQPFIKAPGIVKKLEYIQNNSKDIAVAFDVIEHTVNPIKFLNNINQKMKNDGFLFLTFPNAGSFKSKLLNNRWGMVVPLAHINFFSKKSCEIALKKSNFELVYISNFSLVNPKRLVKNFIKLPGRIFLDLIKFNTDSIFFRIREFFLNILDLINGDQMMVVAIKKNTRKL